MTMLAQNTFTVKRATKDGYSCSLSSYSVMLNADSNGVVNGLSAASTAVKLYQGSTAVTPVISIDSTSNCSAGISGLNVSIVSVPNNTKSGYVDIKIVYGSFVKIERYSFTVVDYTIVKSYTQSIVGDQMTSYATKATVDALGNTVSDHSSKIQQNASAISSTVSSVDKLSNRVSTAETAISQFPGQIALKASQSDVTALGNRMASAEAKITPDAIKLTVLEQTSDIAAYLRGATLHNDPEFKEGYNDIVTYDNNGSGKVTITRMTMDNVPNTSGYVLKVHSSSAASPSCGGWYFADYCKPNHILICRFIAKIPSGYNIYWHSNSVGSGGWQKWLTDTAGTGDWKEYICQVKCGAGGNSITNFFALSGETDWYLAYATTIDASNDITDQIKSQFTIDTGGISMLGKKISLVGMVTFSSLASDAQNKISTAQSAADAANSAASKAQSTADAKASTAYVDDAKGAAISVAASDATTKAGQAKTDAINSAALDATGKANTALSSAKGYTDSLKGSLGDLAWESAVGLAKLDDTIIDGGYIKTNLINAVKIVTQGLSAQTIDAGNATIKNLIVDTATVKTATLVKASGTFTELQCVNDNGNVVFTFNSTAVNMDSVDMYNQGTKGGRALRFYASDIRCRGSLGAYTRNYVIVNMGIASYYVNGDTTSSVKVNLGTTTYNGRTYYMIPLYPAYGESGLSAISATGNCKINDVYGFPVDEVIIINNAGSYYYNLIGYAGKKVTLVNATDSFNNNYFASCENAAHQLKGGVTMSLINVNPFFMSGSRTINSIDKSCWMIAGWYDNDFN